MRLLALTSAALLALAPATLGAVSASAAAPEPTPAPLTGSKNAVPGQYIVTLDKEVGAAGFTDRLRLTPKHLYSSALNGFAAQLTPLQLDTVRKSPGVTSVEEDTQITADPNPAAKPGLRGPAASWGLDRIDQEDLPLDNDFTVGGNGAGVTAYILDTGIDYAHDEFGGRATFGFDAMPDAATQRGQDCHGHGTHVAGTVGGRTYGVATNVNLVSVRVLGCDGSGSYSGIIAGLDWVSRNAKQPAVLNGSLGGPRSTAVNNAADALAAAGVLPVIAAGNSAADACNVSPASANRVLTVAASTRNDEQATFSNWGRCVELFAPGTEILSARLGGGSVALQGTSMAAPHVAGVAALYKQAHPAEVPERIVDFLRTQSSKDKLTRLSTGTPNQLLNTGGL
ncbi:S8 family peptidase [Streptomyces sp. NPDC002920]